MSSRLRLMLDVVRHHFDEMPSTTIAPHFPGPLEWEASLGFDDGNARARLRIDGGPTLYSEQFRAWVRPQVVVLITTDAQPLPPYGTYPVELPRPQPLSAGPPEPVEGPELERILRDPARRENRSAQLVHWLMQQHGGHDLYRQADGSFGFTITFPDEPPWIPG